MLAQPYRKEILIAAKLDPVDAARGAAMLDEPAARVIRVIDMPLDEKGKTFAEGGVERHEVPLEHDAVGTATTHPERLAPGSLGGCLDVVGAQAERSGPFADLDESSFQPRPHPARSRLVAVNDSHELDVAAAERHDAVASAVASVTPARNRCEAVLLVILAARCAEVLDDDDDMVDG
jgi:hypothetical protein